MSTPIRASSISIVQESREPPPLLEDLIPDKNDHRNPEPTEENVSRCYLRFMLALSIAWISKVAIPSVKVAEQKLSPRPRPRRPHLIRLRDQRPRHLIEKTDRRN
jgi:hypothetical protein